MAEQEPFTAKGAKEFRKRKAEPNIRIYIPLSALQTGRYSRNLWGQVLH
jgi:hypothetical protein